ncbi:MAG: hypothetical protein QNJ23_00690 [Woeseiaceae bacterium]|nr:hypothetical protein [Woeseiaceae bacterium]
MPGKRNGGNGERVRQTVAQEAARLIVEHGIRDFRVAKTKAAERLGISGRGALPGNGEIELAVSNHLSLFGGDSHASHLGLLREAALTAMDMLAAFSPRLVGPVLQGTADHNSAVNLHVFADSPEAIAFELHALGFDCRPYERRLKTSRGKGARPESFAGYEFQLEHAAVQATIFPIDGIRQAPISPVDGKPMKRANRKAVEELLERPMGATL